MATNERKPGLKARLLDRLHDPFQLRVAITATVLLTAYVAIYSPLSERIEAASRKLAMEKKRLELARTIGRLRAQHQSFANRIPEKSDTKEWAQYVLDGLRRFPLEVVDWKGEPTRDLGPYKAVVLRIELQGAFADMNGFLGWLETNERLFRVDVVRIQPPNSGGTGKLVMQLTVLGVMG